MHYRIAFYQDVTRYHLTEPCWHHGRTYDTLDAAEAAAIAELPDVQSKHSGAGYAVFQSDGHCIAIGPGRA